MRCKIDFDEDKLLIEQNVRAWGANQSTKEDPAYKEEDIKSEKAHDYFRGYKMALDDVCAILNSFVEDGQMEEELSEDIQSLMGSELCMLLFSILDEQEDEEE